ncbi:hypothetical protein [Hymenobacter lucidus]|uniref:Uncharacterized protein n=1 Tax=Hymenobacter lucidus TaxID=2880930 RepID=A0ABS8APH4_9BACT|nr:hypothetical protein [Hymenobacter lucidus]MCB2407923.1 hypothetical protein [Hymenobacter lucidus]
MPTNIADLSWEVLKKHVYRSDGSLPDVIVLDTNRDDWRRWVDFVQANYPVRFLYRGDEEPLEQEKIDLAAVFTYWDNDLPGNAPFAYVTIGRIQFNCFFLSDDTIDCDIDPREIKEQDDHAQLLHFLTSVAALLGKKIVVVEEGAQFVAGSPLNREPLFTVDQYGATVTVNAW